MMTSADCVGWVIKGSVLMSLLFVRVNQAKKYDVQQPPQNGTVVCTIDPELGKLCMREVIRPTAEHCAENAATDWRCDPPRESVPEPTKSNGETHSH